MFRPRAPLPVTGDPDDGTTAVCVGNGASGVGDTGADDGDTIGEMVPSCVGRIAENGATRGGADDVTDSGADV